jgi:hypothetical protein
LLNVIFIFLGNTASSMASEMKKSSAILYNVSVFYSKRKLSIRSSIKVSINRL